MYDPNDDPDDISGSRDGAPMETTSPPVRPQSPDAAPRSHRPRAGAQDRGRFCHTTDVAHYSRVLAPADLAGAPAV